jgi:membrane protease YdiL (CAAX protease family)
MPVAAALFATTAGLFFMMVVGGALAKAGVGMRATVVLAELALATPALLVASMGIRTPAAVLGLRRVPGTTVLLSVLCGAALWVASAGLVETQAHVWPPPPEVFQFLDKMGADLGPSHGVATAANVGALAVAPALAEELVFRGMLLGSLAGAGSAPFAVAASALAFAAIHVEPASYRMPFAFLLGIALGGMRLRTGSVLPGIVAHGVLNSITLLAAPWLDAPTDAAATPLGLALGLLGGGAAVATALIVAMARLTSDGARQ